MLHRAFMLLLSCAGLIASSFADPPKITYRLESDGIFTSPEAGALFPSGLERDNWEETYLQELRVFLKGKASPQVGYRIKPRFQYSYADSSAEFDWTLDQGYAYVDFSDHLTVTGGKQRIRWGTGMTFTPTDRWQPSTNSLDPTRYLEGLFLFRADSYLPFVSMTAVYSPSRENVENRYEPDHVAGIRLYKLIGTLDVYLSATRSLYSYRLNYITGATEPADEDEINYGAALSWDAGPAVIYGEVSHLRLTTGTLRHLLVPHTDSWQQRIVLGASKRFSSSTSMYIETYYNGWGLNHGEYEQFRKMIYMFNTYTMPPIQYEEFYSQMMSLASPARALHQWYVAFNGSYLYKETWGATGNIIYEPVDNTLFAYPQLSYRGIENMNFMLGYSTVLGGNDSEKSLLPVIHTIDFRFIVYF